MQTISQCPHCRQSLPQRARFCTGCGRSLDTTQQFYGASSTGATTPLSTLYQPAPGYISKDERNWAMLCHLSAMLVYVIPYAHIIAPLILWMMKRDTSDFINDQGKEALNYNLSIMIYMTIAALFSCFLIGIPVLIGLAVFDFIIMIVAAVRASNGEYYRYPITIRFIK